MRSVRSVRLFSGSLPEGGLPLLCSLRGCSMAHCQKAGPLSSVVSGALPEGGPPSPRQSQKPVSVAN